MSQSTPWAAKKPSKKIIEKEADYVFSLKGNQTSLNDDVIRYFDDAQKNKELYPEITKQQRLITGTDGWKSVNIS